MVAGLTKAHFVLTVVGLPVWCVVWLILRTTGHLTPLRREGMSALFLVWFWQFALGAGFLQALRGSDLLGSLGYGLFLLSVPLAVLPFAIEAVAGKADHSSMRDVYKAHPRLGWLLGPTATILAGGGGLLILLSLMVN